MDQTDTEDEARPLSPDERKALRRLIQNEDAILEAGNIVSHGTWLGKMLFRILTFVTAIVAFVGAMITVKTWAGWK